MVTRRAFLIGSAATITLSLVDKFYTFIENHGEPLIQAPKNPSGVLYVYPDRDYQLGLNGDPWKIDFPYASWQEYLVEEQGYDNPTKLSDFRAIYRDWGFMPSQLQEPVPWEHVAEMMERRGPGADAFHLLDSLDIGPYLEFDGRVAGGLKFYDGPMPGSNYLGVEAEDDISVSLLQHRPNQLNTGIAVQVDG